MADEKEAIVKSVATTDMLDLIEYSKLVNVEVQRRGYPPMRESLVQTNLNKLKKKGEIATTKRGSFTEYGKPLPPPATEAAVLPTTPITVCARTTTPPRTTAPP
jgi:hypothetical protein